MISKINYLRDFGSYRQFQWGTTAPFSKRNLIYGWNYSGKTTLSRLFQILEEPTQVSEWPGSQFEVELEDGIRLNHSNLSDPIRIRVFNRDFVRDNFQQEYKAPAVFIVGGSTIHLRNRIARLNQHEAKIRLLKGRFNESHQQQRRDLDSLGTTHASSIATLTGDKTYNRPKLFAEIERVKASVDSFLLTEEVLQAKVSLLRSTQEWTIISPVDDVAVDVDALRRDLSAVMQKTASNEAIAKLKDNRDLESWIRAGLTHHVNSDQCEYCGSTISDERLAALRNHFSMAYEELTGEVSSLITTLEGTELGITLPDERDFVPDLRSQYTSLKTSVEEWIAWAQAAVNELLSLARRKQLKLETQQVCTVDTSRFSEAASIVFDINAIIAAHNHRCGQIDKEKRAAKEAIEKHQAAEFYAINKVVAKESAIQVAKKKVDKADALLRKITDGKAAIEEQIQRQSVAAQKINDTVRFLLPNNEISVTEVPGGFFEFRRNNLQANNLSEGERTAITFAYFLATLENNGATLDDTIVFIDDPISSLDTNHIYSIYALITKQLESSLQIFVATHNGELYTLLKDHWFYANQQYSNRGDACSYYIRRFLDGTDHQWHSTLEDTPILLRKYKSEYLFVFDQLHQFVSSQAPTLHEAYTSPNLLRKFLEAYLGFVKPSVSKWSDKLDLLFDAVVDQVEIQKFADDASHMQGLNRALQQPDFIPNAQNSVRKVIQALKVKDLPHYRSLCTVIGVTP